MQNFLKSIFNTRATIVSCTISTPQIMTILSRNVSVFCQNLIARKLEIFLSIALHFSIIRHKPRRAFTQFTKINMQWAKCQHISCTVSTYQGRIELLTIISRNCNCFCRYNGYIFLNFFVLVGILASSDKLGRRASTKFNKTYVLSFQINYVCIFSLPFFQILDKVKHHMPWERQCSTNFAMPVFPTIH